MSVQILAESVISLERTLVYQTVFKIFCCADSTEETKRCLANFQHCLIPNPFINAIASLPEKTEPAECSLITPGGHLPPKTLPTF